MIGAIFFVTVPATIIRSLWRGEERKSMPNRSGTSKRGMDIEIISMAQHARPKPIGHSEERRAQFTRKSRLVMMTFLSKRSSRPIGHSFNREVRQSQRRSFQY